jgi:hypothetical protein
LRTDLKITMGQPIRNRRLTETDLRIADGRRRIAEQERLLSELQDEGQDLTVIRMTLRTLQDLQDELEQQRELLLREDNAPD